MEVVLLEQIVLIEDHDLVVINELLPSRESKGLRRHTKVLFLFLEGQVQPPIIELIGTVVQILQPEDTLASTRTPTDEYRGVLDDTAVEDLIKTVNAKAYRLNHTDGSRPDDKNVIGSLLDTTLDSTAVPVSLQPGTSTPRDDGRVLTPTVPSNTSWNHFRTGAGAVL